MTLNSKCLSRSFLTFLTDPLFPPTLGPIPALTACSISAAIPPTPMIVPFQAWPAGFGLLLPMLTLFPPTVTNLGSTSFFSLSVRRLLSLVEPTPPALTALLGLTTFCSFLSAFSFVIDALGVRDARFSKDLLVFLPSGLFGSLKTSPTGIFGTLLFALPTLSRDPPPNNPPAASLPLTLPLTFLAFVAVLVIFFFPFFFFPSLFLLSSSSILSALGSLSLPALSTSSSSALWTLTYSASMYFLTLSSTSTSPSPSDSTPNPTFSPSSLLPRLRFTPVTAPSSSFKYFQNSLRLSANSQPTSSRSPTP
mmetsp:Transcript_18378/g.38264  ORF Transcript_18378/g.38264 Transcript_18378/m.38264 type:complete len:308 (+) Transcript_18378:46-969(+)